jgi:CheY-like chemotaxis protein
LNKVNELDGKVDIVFVDGKIAADRSAMLIIKVKRINSNIKIMILAEDETDKTRVLEYGANEFAAKPISAETIVDKVYSVCLSSIRFNGRYRYNPGIIAQAFASLDVLHPGRISPGVGSGEAMNGVPIGFDWPDIKVRLARTSEAIQVIKKLWKEGRKGGSGFVDFEGLRLQSLMFDFL